MGQLGVIPTAVQKFNKYQYVGSVINLLCIQNEVLSCNIFIGIGRLRA